MNRDIDPYAILDIDRDATPEEIAASYREKARRYHPDTGGDSWAFKRVQEAYEMLCQEGCEAGSSGYGSRPQSDNDAKTQGSSLEGHVLPPVALVTSGAIVGAVLGAGVAFFFGGSPLVGLLVGCIPGAIAGGVTAPSRQ